MWRVKEEDGRTVQGADMMLTQWQGMADRGAL